MITTIVVRYNGEKYILTKLDGDEWQIECSSWVRSARAVSLWVALSCVLDLPDAPIVVGWPFS